jgi:benzoyl-CoA reductase/2-hydroxyglutaryl-CoA dehydratase subunit BcrC/BadD/HgdB
MNPIPTTGDMFDHLATNFQNCGVGYGADNMRQIQPIVDFVIKHKIDGVVYNQLFGCHSVSTGYSRLRTSLMKNEIPSTMITFSKLGENREQLKTRIGALVELIKKY